MTKYPCSTKAHKYLQTVNIAARKIWHIYTWWNLSKPAQQIWWHSQAYGDCSMPPSKSHVISKKGRKVCVHITASSAITNFQLHNEFHLLKYFLFSFPFNTLEIRLKASALLPVKEIHQLRTIPGKWTQVNIMSTSNKPVLPLITIIFSFYRQQNLLTANAFWDRIFCQCYENCQRSNEQFCFF